MKVRGIVEQVSEKEAEGDYGSFTKMGVRIGDKWYNGIKKEDWDPAQKGDEVILELEQKGEYLNMVGITNLAATSPKPAVPKPATSRAAPSQEDRERWSAKDLLIVRQNALMHADAHMNQLIAQGQKPIEKEYFDFAQRCVDWVYKEPEKRIPGAQDYLGSFAQDEKKKVKVEKK